MKMKLFTLCFALIFVCGNSPLALTQTQTNSTTDNWVLVKSIPGGEDLEIKLKNRETIKGTFYTATDSLLSVSRKGKLIDLDRNEVSKVYIVKSGDEDNAKLWGGIGSLAGFFIGLAVTLNVGLREGSNRGGQKAIATAALPVGIIGGALAGRAIGKRRARRLIYDAT